jgi:hypothetical protein
MSSADTQFMYEKSLGKCVFGSAICLEEKHAQSLLYWKKIQCFKRGNQVLNHALIYFLDLTFYDMHHVEV